MGRAVAPSLESASLRNLRRFLSATLMLGVVGMGTELLLIGHVEGVFQLVPVTLLGAGAAALVWNAARPRALTVWVVRLAMASFVASGLVGVILHYQGNREFELEMSPSMSGTALLLETVTGATPVLAPGSMTLLGLVGLATTFHHPALTSGSAASTAFDKESQS